MGGLPSDEREPRRGEGPPSPGHARRLPRGCYCPRSCAKPSKCRSLTLGGGKDPPPYGLPGRIEERPAPLTSRFPRPACAAPLPFPRRPTLEVALANRRWKAPPWVQRPSRNAHLGKALRPNQVARAASLRSRRNATVARFGPVIETCTARRLTGVAPIWRVPVGAGRGTWRKATAKPTTRWAFSGTTSSRSFPSRQRSWWPAHAPTRRLRSVEDESVEPPI